MGYTLIIGERTGNGGAQEITLPQAPVFAGDELTGQSNKRQLSSRAFEEFCAATGLSAILSQPLKRQHPGSLEITRTLVSQIAVAQRTYEKRHRLPAGFGPFHDAHKARLRWLCWWMEWALRTCRQPVLAHR